MTFDLDALPNDRGRVGAAMDSKTTSWGHGMTATTNISRAIHTLFACSAILFSSACATTGTSTSSVQPDEQVTYSDPEGFRAYSERDEWEIRREREVSVSAEAAFDAWFTKVWEGNTRAVMLNPGEGRGHVGSARTVEGMGMTETILQVGLPSSSTAGAEVPSISYTLEHFTASSYMGYVRFYPTGPETTRIVWCAKWTPSVAGYLLFGGYPLVLALESAMDQAMVDLEEEAKSKQGAAAP